MVNCLSISIDIEFILEDDSIISFVYSQYEYENGSYQEFFTICIMSKDDYGKALNNPRMTGEFLTEKDGQVYVLNVSLDVAIMDSEKTEEYSKLNLSSNEI